MRRIAAHTAVTGLAAVAALEAPVILIALVTVFSYNVRLALTDAHHVVAFGSSTFAAGTCDDKSVRERFSETSEKRFLTSAAVLQANRIAEVVRRTDLAVIAVGVVAAEQTASGGRVTGARYAEIRVS